MGLRGAVMEDLQFDNVKVGPEMILGVEGLGWEIATQITSSSRFEFQFPHRETCHAASVVEICIRGGSGCVDAAAFGADCAEGQSNQALRGPPRLRG